MSVVCRGLTLANVVFLVALTARAKSWIHPDCAMYLHIGELILDGWVPYVDFVEINPPLVMYVHAVPVAIARSLGVSSISVFNAMVSLLAGLGAWVVLRQLAHLAPRLSEPHRHLVANVWLGFSFLILIAGQWTLPTAVAGTDYGQREHLIVLGYLPFVFLRMTRWRRPDVRPSRAEAIAGGALAGLVLCLKPHFLLAAALIELHLLVENKRLRPLLTPEVYAAVAVGLLYAAHFAVMPAPMRDAFFSRWLPLTASRYKAYDWPWEHVFSLESLHVSVVLAVAVWLPFREPYRAMLRRAAPFATFALASSLVMISQHKGWPYHIIPMMAGICLTLVWVLAEVMQLQSDEAPSGSSWLERAQRQLVLVRAPLCIFLVAGWYASVLRHSPALFRRFKSESLALIERATAPGDAVVYVTTAVQTVYPEALHSKRAPGSRFLWTFPIAYLFEGRTEKLSPEATYEPPVGREAEAEQLLRELTEDVQKRKPKLVFLWRGGGCQGCPPGFSIHGFLHRRRFHLEALQGYFETQQVGHWTVYARDDVELPRRRR